MLLEAIDHRPKQNYAYAYDGSTVHLRLRTKKDDIPHVYAWVGDKYCWEQSAQLVPMSKLVSDELFDYWEAEAVPPLRRLKYGFLLQKGKKKLWMTENGFQEKQPEGPNRLFEFPFINPADVFTPPAWVKDAVFYQIFPERFANGDSSNDPADVQPWGGKPTPRNFFGGDLQGVIDRLDHLTKLGVNAIYFTPIFEATTNHKYDTQDYMKVDPQFGTNEKLKELVEECHKRGIRVLLDAVFNHSGKTFAPFVDVLEKGADSRYADWFSVREFPLVMRDGIPTYDTFAFEPLMPKLNTGNPEVKEYLLNVARYWIEEVGIDGWRLDVANEVDHEFWRDFRRVVKKANPEAYILGEIWHDSMMWLQGDQFDAVMNYPWTDAVTDFFVNRTKNAEEFAHAISKQIARYPRQVTEVAFNLLDSHDTPRMLSLCGNDKRKLKLMALFMLTFMGTPCIYYGDEIGMDGMGDPECRKCMEWDESKQDLELFSFYQLLISLRKAHSVLRDGSFRFLTAKADDTRVAYERKDAAGTFVILMNNHHRSRSVKAAVKAELFTDMLSGEAVTAVGGKLNVSLPAFGYAVLKADEA